MQKQSGDTHRGVHLAQRFHDDAVHERHAAVHVGVVDARKHVALGRCDDVRLYGPDVVEEADVFVLRGFKRHVPVQNVTFYHCGKGSPRTWIEPRISRDVCARC